MLEQGKDPTWCSVSHAGGPLDPSSKPWRSEDCRDPCGAIMGSSWRKASKKKIMSENAATEGGGLTTHLHLCVVEMHTKMHILTRITTRHGNAPHIEHWDWYSRAQCTVHRMYVYYGVLQFKKKGSCILFHF